MKRLVIMLILLVLPFVYSEEVYVPETFKTESFQVTSYFYTGDKLIASKTDTETNYYHVDRLGTTRLSIGANSVSIGETKTLPFGEEVINDNKFSFTGKELDSELYYFGARYYDFDSGRFTSVDPTGVNYQYVSNNPMNYIDPDGEEIDDPILMAEGFKDNKPANFVIDIIPLLGDAKGIGEGIVGYDSLGNQLAWWERGINFLGVGELRGPLALAASIPAMRWPFKALVRTGNEADAPLVELVGTTTKTEAVRYTAGGDEVGELLAYGKVEPRGKLPSSPMGIGREIKTYSSDTFDMSALNGNPFYSVSTSSDFERLIFSNHLNIEEMRKDPYDLFKLSFRPGLRGFDLTNLPGSIFSAARNQKEFILVGGYRIRDVTSIHRLDLDSGLWRPVNKRLTFLE